MKIDKLTRLIGAFSSSSQYTQEAQKVAQGSQQSDDAAKVSSDMRGDSARAAKVNALKEQVAAGRYKPDSTEVAKALVNDLFY